MNTSLGNIVANLVAASPLTPKGLRRRLYRWVGFDLADGVIVLSGSTFKSHDLTIGARTFINHGCFFDEGPITIGKDVALGPGVKLIGIWHEIGGPERRWVGYDARPIVIGDGCGVGANTIIHGGVTVAAGCVIGSGSVVTKDTEPNGVYVGNPARRIRDLEA